MYGNTLHRSSELPDIVNEFKTPEGLVLAADKTSISPCELEGDVFALRFVDLSKEGLDVYTDTVKRLVTPIRRFSDDESVDAEILSYNLIN